MRSSRPTKRHPSLNRGCRSRGRGRRNSTFRRRSGEEEKRRRGGDSAADEEPTTEFSRPKQNRATSDQAARRKRPRSPSRWLRSRGSRLTALITARNSSTGWTFELAICRAWTIIIESMFDSLVTATDGTFWCCGGRGMDARGERGGRGGWPSTADMLEAGGLPTGRPSASNGAGQLGCGSRGGGCSAERLDGRGLPQLMVAMALRERLPRVAEVFATGAISYRLVARESWRVLACPRPRARVRLMPRWRPSRRLGGLSVAKAEAAMTGG